MMNSRMKMIGMVGIVALCTAALSACAAATAVPTEVATPAATEAMTEAPTEAAMTEAPTEAATATEAPTEAMTEAMTEAAGPMEVTVNMATDPTLGPILVGGNGMTLYLFTKDTPNETTCYGKCATAWPPLLIDENGKVTAGPGVTGTFSTVARGDGTYMVAYNDVALYYYQKDTKPGDVLGEGVQDVWHIVKP
jgi:predicted lipoprotein with Yx(FWY)xxD motif